MVGLRTKSWKWLPSLSSAHFVQFLPKPAVTGVCCHVMTRSDIVPMQRGHEKNWIIVVAPGRQHCLCLKRRVQAAVLILAHALRNFKLSVRTSEQTCFQRKMTQEVMSCFVNFSASVTMGTPSARPFQHIPVVMLVGNWERPSSQPHGLPARYCWWLCVCWTKAAGQIAMQRNPLRDSFAFP